MNDAERIADLTIRLERAVEKQAAQDVTIAAQAQLLADCRRVLIPLREHLKVQAPAGISRATEQIRCLLERMENVGVPKADGE